MRILACITTLMMLVSASPSFAQEQLTPEQREWIAKAERRGQEGWIFLHVEGEPFECGFQNGYLTAREIEETVEIISYYLGHTTGKDWEFYREVAERLFMPKLEQEYRLEIEGIVAGLRAAGVTDLDVADIVAYNGWIELAWYYLPWLQAQETGQAPAVGAHGSCSSFIATGNATFDGRIVIAHNLWYEYMFCVKWNVILDLAPARGNRFITQSFPGWIFGGTDFWINSAGLVVAETTMSSFVGFDPQGIPEFARIRKALQYGNSIDDFAAIMLEGNNGGYANDWLIGDIKTGEIARLELGLKNQRLWRTFDGYYAGSNAAQDPKVRAEETTMDYGKPDSSPNGRWARWQELMRDYYGKIDCELAKRFLGDHYDTYNERYNPSSRTLCGHVERDPLGLPEWGWGSYYPGGAIDGKVTDSDLASTMTLHAKFGHSCSITFLAEEFLQQHPEYDWQRPYLFDLPSYDWTVFRAKGFREKK
jgi:hypothetical protein